MTKPPKPYELEPGYVRKLQRAVFELIEFAKALGHNDNEMVNQAKELIRCRVLQCGNAGACDGKGLSDYRCPLAGVEICK